LYFLLAYSYSIISTGRNVTQNVENLPGLHSAAVGEH